jgi:hypothetical protein
MKKTVSALFLLLITMASFSQKMKMPKGESRPVITQDISKADLQKMRAMQDTLHKLSNLMVFDSVPDVRRKACYDFIPKLVTALKLDNSFFFPFDSFETISKVYPADSSFRIFTWQVLMTTPIKIASKNSKTGRDTVFQKPIVRYYGVIQMRSKQLKMFPLFASDTLPYGTEKILGPKNWLGQLYYNMMQETVNGKNYYTLFGYEVPDLLTRRKIIDILTFDEQGQPRFGAPMFWFKYDDSTSNKTGDTLSRFYIEYKYDATPVLNYDKELEMIVFDHVAPPNDKSKGASFTYVPDGTYEGFKWINNHWQWIEKVFTFAINEDDNPPIPAPLFGTPKHQPELPKDGDPR